MSLALFYARVRKVRAVMPPGLLALARAILILSFSLLFSVELDLGLFDEAEEKFQRAIGICDTEMLPAATYGRGISLLAMAKRDIQDGKGSAYSSLLQGIEGCRALGDSTHGCVQKLIGDLYTLGAALPPDMFSGSDDESEESTGQRQKSFISNGEDAYREAEQLVTGSDEESAVLRSILMTDLGANLLLQAQLLSLWGQKGIHQEKLSPRASEMYEKAADEFRRAIDSSPLYAPAWCGLGCAVARSDPMLAQHAFSRSLELDPLFPDAYANLSFLYTDQKSFAASAKVSDALTEVADSPMMWINRALILEHQGAESPVESIEQAADAYRAALQVVKHPSALLGLALSCRMTGKDRFHSAQNYEGELAMESSCNVTEYLGFVGQGDVPTTLFDGILTTELAAMNPAGDHEQMLLVGREQVMSEVGRLRKEPSSQNPANTALLDHVELLDVLSKDTNDSIAEDESNGTDPMEGLPLERRIVLEPDRGDLWVQYAQQMAASDEPERAMTACRRAVSLLEHQFLHTTVHAPDLSDALALKVWLEELVPKDETSKDEQEANANSVDLQRCLLMCPDHPLGREAVKLLAR
jgi:tetratricopeptide (TPR) repeat protein